MGAGPLILLPRTAERKIIFAFEGVNLACRGTGKAKMVRKTMRIINTLVAFGFGHWLAVESC